MVNKVIAAPVPTNVITGFLGVGKTTVIQHLLTHRSAGERWAVLVNEFGEIGIDAALLHDSEHGITARGDQPQQHLAEQQPNNPGIFVREVPGGCMCCASGIPMRVALNLLLTEAKPDRLLIEPTGLGHPAEVLEVLQSEHYRSVLALQASLTLVDARKVRQERYRNHPTFRQQLQVADRVIASKSDLYRDNELQDLRDFLAILGKRQTPITAVQYGEVPVAWLDQVAADHSASVATEITTPEPVRYPSDADPALAATAVVKPVLKPAATTVNTRVSNPSAQQFLGFFNLPTSEPDFVADGQVYPKHNTFSYQRVFDLLSGATAERLKAVFITERGAVGFNLADGVLQVTELSKALDSRIEWISAGDDTAADLRSGLHRAML